MAEERIVYTMVHSKKDSERIARRLVETRLAACVNIIPHLESIYRWEGEIKTEMEFLLVIKTVHSQLEGVIAKIKKLHPYELPEIIAIPVVAGSREYLDWLHAETTSA